MEDQNKTVIVDIDIPFIRLVILIIKVTLASIPALIVVWAIIAALMIVFGGFGAMWMHGPRPF